MTRRCVLFLSAVPLLALAQKIDAPPAILKGTLKSIAGKKKLIVEVEEGNTMEFYTGRKTEYYEGKKRIALADLKQGDVLTIEARAHMDVGGTYDALVVRREALQSR